MSATSNVRIHIPPRYPRPASICSRQPGGARPILQRNRYLGSGHDIALTFLRVVQESIHNIAKHSHAITVEVKVTGLAEELRLMVRDNGAGLTFKMQRLHLVLA
jgi:hypothetical protein